MTIPTPKSAGANQEPAPIETTPLFWDCECERKYIRPKTKFRCWHCGVDAADMPDARVSEIEHTNARPHRALPFEDGDLVIIFALGTDANGALVDVLAVPAKVKTSNRLYAFVDDCAYRQTDGIDNATGRYRIALATPETLAHAATMLFTWGQECR